jgi:hypothetical protein
MVVKELRVTFLAAAEGGRSSLASLREGGYSPHLRPDVGPLLGIRFLRGRAGSFTANVPALVAVELLYESTVDYSAMKSGAPIAVVEGAKVVGWAEVL